MKTTFRLLLIIIVLLTVSCKDESVVMSAIQDGKEGGTTINFELAQNYPNPFNPTTDIMFGVYKKMNLKMSIYTEDWELVKVLIDDYMNPGYYRIVFDAVKDNNECLPSGNYYYTLEGEGLTLTRTMKLLK